MAPPPAPPVVTGTIASIDQALLNDANQARWEAYHFHEAYKLRAAQLTTWKRNLDFLSLGVTPGIIFAIVTFENAMATRGALIISGLLSCSTWLWAILSYTHKWDTQLEVSQSIPREAEAVSTALRDAMDRFSSADNPTKREQRRNAVTELINRVRQLKEQCEKSQTHVDNWMNLIAQQSTMRKAVAPCANCGQYWKAGQAILTPRQARKFLKRVEKMDAHDKLICSNCHKIKYCPKCGQDTPSTANTEQKETKQ